MITISINDHIRTFTKETKKKSSPLTFPVAKTLLSTGHGSLPKFWSFLFFSFVFVFCLFSFFLVFSSIQELLLLDLSKRKRQS